MLLCNHPKKQARQQSDHAPNILTATNRRNTHLEAESWNSRSSRMLGEYSPERREETRAPGSAAATDAPPSRPAAPTPTQPGRHARLLEETLGRKWRGRVFLSPFQEFPFDLIGSLRVGTPCWRGNRVCLRTGRRK